MHILVAYMTAHIYKGNSHYGISEVDKSNQILNKQIMKLESWLNFD